MFQPLLSNIHTQSIVRTGESSGEPQHPYFKPFTTEKNVFLKNPCPFSVTFTSLERSVGWTHSFRFFIVRAMQMEATSVRTGCHAKHRTKISFLSFLRNKKTTNKVLTVLRTKKTPCESPPLHTTVSSILYVPFFSPPFSY